MSTEILNQINVYDTVKSEALIYALSLTKGSVKVLNRCTRDGCIYVELLCVEVSCCSLLLCNYNQVDSVTSGVVGRIISNGIASFSVTR